MQAWLTLNKNLAVAESLVDYISSNIMKTETPGNDFTKSELKSIDVEAADLCFCLGNERYTTPSEGIARRQNVS